MTRSIRKSLRLRKSLIILKKENGGHGHPGGQPLCADQADGYHDPGHRSQAHVVYQVCNPRAQNVNISGVALDNTTVADFMVRLENSGLFKEVDLKTLKRAKA